MVAMPSEVRAAATNFMAGWCERANAKQMPAASRQCLSCPDVSSSLTPSRSSTSADPLLLEAERLPCLTTFTPAAATTRAAAVEMLNVPRTSPPVPQVSSTTQSASHPTGTLFSRMTVAAPTSSSTVVPLAASPTSSPPICASDASPDMMRSNASRASARVRSSRRQSFRRMSRRRDISGRILPRVREGTKRFAQVHAGATSGRPGNPHPEARLGAQVGQSFPR